MCVNYDMINKFQSGNSVWTKASGLKKVAKLTIFGIFDKHLSTLNVKVARSALNVEWDIFGDFETLCSMQREKDK